MDNLGTSWSYYAPYHPNIASVLTNLRQQVFARGDYHLAHNPALQMNESQYRAEISDYPSIIQDEMLNEWRYLTGLSQPDTIDALLIWNGNETTHSILDIEYVSDVPDYGVAAPLSDKALNAIFGTTHPTREQIENKALALQLLRTPNQATYIIVYKNHKPNEIYFVGVSQ